MLTPEMEADLLAAEAIAAAELNAALAEAKAAELLVLGDNPPRSPPLTAAAGMLLGRRRPAND